MPHGNKKTFLDTLPLISTGDGDVRAFGLVLFTEQHPNTWSALCDDFFFRSLDIATGGNWVLYGCRAYPRISSYPEYSANAFNAAVSVQKEPKENQYLIQLLMLDSTENIPCIVLFLTLDRDDYLFTLFPLDDSTVDNAKSSIRYVVEQVTSMLNDIAASSLDVLEIKTALKRRSLKIRLIKRLNGFKSFLREFNSLIPPML